MQFCCNLSHPWQTSAEIWQPSLVVSAQDSPSPPEGNVMVCQARRSTDRWRHSSFVFLLSLFSQAELFILPRVTYVLLQGGRAKFCMRANFEIWHASQMAFFLLFCWTLCHDGHAGFGFSMDINHWGHTGTHSFTF